MLTINYINRHIIHALLTPQLDRSFCCLWCSWLAGFVVHTVIINVANQILKMVTSSGVYNTSLKDKLIILCKSMFSCCNKWYGIQKFCLSLHFCYVNVWSWKWMCELQYSPHQSLHSRVWYTCVCFNFVQKIGGNSSAAHVFSESRVPHVSWVFSNMHRRITCISMWILKWESNMSTQKSLDTCFNHQALCVILFSYKYS